MTLQELLKEQELTSALILDDGYDAVPRAQDIVGNEEGWSLFFQDSAAYESIIEESYPGYAAATPEDLRRSDGFVRALWNLRDKIPSDTWNGLFSTYEGASDKDRKYLDSLEASLRSLGLEPIQSGREINEKGRESPIIFVDLFLGASQKQSDMDASIALLHKLLAHRRKSPPLVVLMSRSPHLSDLKTVFRDKAELLGAMFRVRDKAELQNPAVVERTLEKLVRHRTDALKMAEFIHAWAVGLEGAKDRFLKTIRRLDLPDYGHIQQLLLDDEKQPLGSYMLDVFDRVLQHEIEASPETINAARALNQLDTQQYPPPYVAGSADLQQLVHAVLFQNRERLQVETAPAGAPVSFGDVLLRRPAVATAPGNAETGGQTQHKSNALDADVLVVITPACDLARKGAKRVMLMAGSLEALAAKNWTYKGSGPRTPILIVSENGQEKRCWVKWDVKDLITITPADLQASISGTGSHHVVARFREGQAIELQQKLLSDLGRVGLVANMPATFPVSVELMWYGRDKELHRMPSPVLDHEAAVCIAGRQNDGDVSRLVLSETCIEELLSNIAALDRASVHDRAVDTLRRLKESTNFSALLEQGLPIPNSEKGKYVPLPIPKPKAEDGTPQPLEGKPAEAGGKAPKIPKEVIGLIARDPSTYKLSAEEEKHGSFVLILREIVSEATQA